MFFFFQYRNVGCFFFFQEMRIIGVLDIDIANSGGKAVQVETLVEIKDLTLFGLSIANNGKGIPKNNPEFSFPSFDFIIPPHVVLWIGINNETLSEYFGYPCFNNDYFIPISKYILDLNGTIFLFV